MMKPERVAIIGILAVGITLATTIAFMCLAAMALMGKMVYHNLIGGC